MLGRNFVYRGLDLSDNANTDIVLTDVARPIPIRTQQYNKSNYHGTYTSNSLAGGRLFIFRGKVFGETEAARWTGWKKIIDVIQPEHNFNTTHRGFYDLTRDTDGGTAMTTKAKVRSAPIVTNELGSPVIDFVFELYAETEKTYNTTVRTATGGVGEFGGISLPYAIPTYLTGYAGYITCSNSGNRPTPVKIEVEGTSLNTKLLNLTNGNVYKIGSLSSPYTTTQLVYDNRNANNNPLEALIVTEAGVSIKDKRSQGGDIFLDPGTNHIVVLSDTVPSTATVTVTRRDAYFLT